MNTDCQVTRFMILTGKESGSCKNVFLQVSLKYNTVQSGCLLNCSGSTTKLSIVAKIANPILCGVPREVLLLGSWERAKGGG